MGGENEPFPFSFFGALSLPCFLFRVQGIREPALTAGDRMALREGAGPGRD